MRRTAAVLCAIVMSLMTLAPRASATAASDFPGMTFTYPTSIWNRFTRMFPGVRMYFRGTVRDRSGTHRHEVVFIVTGLTKLIDGVTTRVIWERDLGDGELEESELAFEAQDDRRNVWNMGEYPEEYEDGTLVGAPSTWIAGVGDGEPGILMQGRPRVGMPAYVQGSSPSVEFRDIAKIYKMHQYVCSPYGCYSDVLVTKEWNAYAPGEGYQLKYYAPRIGNLRVAALGGDSREVLKLISVKRLSPSALDNVNLAVEEIDARGRATNTTYALTPPVGP